MRHTSRGQFFLRAMLTDAWTAATVMRVRAAARRAGVIVHDPQAHDPKNLDDPFIDPRVQERIGKFIADSGRQELPASKGPGGRTAVPGGKPASQGKVGK
jgi:hypothetical protein